MSAIVEIILPLLCISLVGYISGAGKWIDLAGAKVLSRYVFMFAMPVAILNFYNGATPPGLELLPYISGYFLAMIITIGISVWIGQKFLNLSVHESGAFSFVSICGNAVFLGLPIALQIEGWGQPFLMLMILEGIFVFGICAAIMQWQKTDDTQATALQQIAKGIQGSMLMPFKNPIVIASLVGVLSAYLQITFPTPIEKFMALFGATAGPTGLFVLGLYVALLPRKGLAEIVPEISTITLIKLLLFPILSGVLVFLFTKGDWTLTATVVLFTAMPPAVASLVQASHYKIYERQTAAAVSVASIASLVTISAILLIFT